MSKIIFKSRGFVAFVKGLLRFFFVVVISIPLLGFSEKELKHQSIRPNMEVIFGYHVEHKEYSPLIVKRSFKTYVEQFDYEKLYLLKGEVERFLNLSDKDIEKIIGNFKKDKFDHFFLLNAYIEKSIERQRRLRYKAIKEILSGKSTAVAPVDGYTDYAFSEDELYQRILCKYYRLIAGREKKLGVQFSQERKEKLYSIYDKRVKRMEGFYYATDEEENPVAQSKQEHYQALHILKAITKSLDSHSSYYSYEEAADLKASLKKQFQGIGVVLREGEEGIFVADMIQGGPAFNSKKVQVGDYLISIDGKNIQDCCFEDILTYLRGEEGSAVELRLKREGASPFVVELKREKVLLNEDRLTYALEPHGNGWIGKIVLPGFYDNGEGVSSEKDLREAIKELKAKGPLHGLVIDLRENSGGFLTQAVKVAGLFITKGIIVISKYSDGEIRYMRDIDGRLYYEGPLVLLTSKASASAAEIVAQALQDYGVAVIVGDERTYGKGSMQYQTVTEENPPAFYKVTVGRYYTISGRSTQIEGVKADIVVETIFSPYNIGERYLEYPISRDNLELEHLMSDKNSSKNFQKKYLPNLQVQETVWKKMLPKLKANSEQRLAKDPNYQMFLKRLKGEVKDSKKSSFGQEDLQLKEAVNIVKDMIQLSKSMQKKA